MSVVLIYFLVWGDGVLRYPHNCVQAENVHCKHRHTIAVVVDMSSRAIGNLLCAFLVMVSSEHCINVHVQNLRCESSSTTPPCRPAAATVRLSTYQSFVIGLFNDGEKCYVKLTLKVLHKIYIDLDVNFMPDFFYLNCILGNYMKLFIIIMHVLPNVDKMNTDSSEGIFICLFRHKYYRA